METLLIDTSVFDEVCNCELIFLDGGCWLCTAGSVIAGASTIGGIVASLPVSGPIIFAATVAGAGLGYLVTK